MMKAVTNPNLILFFIAAIFIGTFAYKLNAGENTQEYINLGNWTQPKLDGLMKTKSGIEGSPEQIDFLSAEFLGTPYQAHTLTGDKDTPELFTINLQGVDCFTYIDYVEALRVSENFPEFKNSLQSIRYKDNEIAFQNRNHFFTDWPVNNPSHVKDVTQEVSGSSANIVTKNLNVKKDGSYYLPGIQPKERSFYYIPVVDEAIVENLDTGDYVGIYTELPGLDVTHTGIVIKKDGRAYLRNASSRKINYKVVDEDLIEYMENKPGLVVFRPINSGE